MEIKYRQKYLHRTVIDEDAPEGWDYCNTRNIGGPWTLDKETVTPWTYVTDIDGKDVYLGDIIVVVDDDDKLGTNPPILLTLDVKGMRTISTIASTRRVKVVGNMFDNPEYAEIALKY